LAGLPQAVTERAHHLLEGLENRAEQGGSRAMARAEAPAQVPAAAVVDQRKQLGLFGAGAAAEPPTVDPVVERMMEELSGQQLDTTTPIQALNLLYKWQRKLKGR